MKFKSVGLFVAGTKGLSLLKGLKSHVSIKFVVSYKSMTDIRTHDEIVKFAQDNKISFFEKNAFNFDTMESVDVAFVAGWQFLIAYNSEKFVVFHDSLLPKYRGFGPTVAALIAGEKRIGVSAIKPVATLDAGPLLAQASADIEYPITINDAYAKLGKLYTDLALQILTHAPMAQEQDETIATYSVWRDEDDYTIDWTASADKICRFVDAVGEPYAGAVTFIQNEKIRILKVRTIPDLNFVERFPGKIWSLNNGIPTIICGQGLLEILQAKKENSDEDYVFSKLRVRLGKSKA